MILKVSEYKMGENRMNEIKMGEIKMNDVKISVNRFIFMLAVVLVLSGCGSNGDPFGEGPGSWQQKFENTWDGIFATRPQNQSHFIALYRLKNPALLENLDEGKVDPDLVKRIGDEQAQFIEAAQKISAEIRVLYRYRLVLNAVTLTGPASVEKDLNQLTLAAEVQPSQSFSRPEILAMNDAVKLDASTGENLRLRNSVKFIGGDIAFNLGIRGQGMKVGIIDTGIDFTHALLGGPGTVEAFKSVDPSQESSLFPNKKVVGGIDLVGSEYNSNSADFRLRIPKPDSNPIDEGGHGSHVAGTVAGVNNLGEAAGTYSGVAPEADLYAIKVFGAEGSTSDEVVIAGLEYAADPTGTLDLSKRLDVVNMSLGSPYGTSHIFYNAAIKNLSKAGTIVVASAGNSGAKAHIVGAPSVAEDAISVAASVDNADHNWKFRAVEFSASLSGKKFLSEAVESPIAKPISEAGDVRGSLVYAGHGNQDFSPELAAAIKGHVALIDRGFVTFAEKMTRAMNAGAVGVVVVNNQEGAAFAMGGDGDITIPSIMITKSLGTQLKAEMLEGEVGIQFQTDIKIEKPELIDTLAGFSSEGPRSFDSLIKPEISSPGYNVISAKMGGGAAGVSMSGTSMAGPHIAGVMALLKQARPELTSRELKSLLMGNAVTIHDEKKLRYPVSRQGAGRVQIERALKGSLVSPQASLSLGEVALDQQKILEKALSLKNISERALHLSLRYEGSTNLRLLNQNSTLEPGGTVDLKLSFRLTSEGLKDRVSQVDGWVKLFEGDQEIHRIPVLAMVRLVSMVQVKRLAIDSTSEIDSFESPVHLELTNKAGQSGQVMLFNSLGLDDRKVGALDPARSRACDLQAAGYRLLGTKLQIAIKTFEPLTTWNTCEISVQLDMNLDGVADQELVGIPLDHLIEGGATDAKSVLLDAPQARQIRKDYEALVLAGDKTTKPNYLQAIQAQDEMILFGHSTVAVVQMELSHLKLNPTGQLALKIATTNVEDYALTPDDYLGKSKDAKGNDQGEWLKLDSTESGQAYREIPALLTVEAKSSLNVDFKKGYGKGGLMVLVPTNPTTFGSLQNDSQLIFAKPKFSF
jgi:minor extracellular serine protease Vpr